MATTVAETFDAMYRAFNPKEAKGLNKVIQWNISGEQAGIWAFRIADGRCERVPGGVDQPDLSFTMRDKDWLDVANGKVNGAMAFMTGRFKVNGDYSLAMRLSKLFPVPPQKKQA
jgi:putative sterol carrier protein